MSFWHPSLEPRLITHQFKCRYSIKLSNRIRTPLPYVSKAAFLFLLTGRSTGRDTGSGPQSFQLTQQTGSTWSRNVWMNIIHIFPQRLLHPSHTLSTFKLPGERVRCLSSLSPSVFLFFSPLLSLHRSNERTKSYTTMQFSTSFSFRSCPTYILSRKNSRFSEHLPPSSFSSFQLPFFPPSNMSQYYSWPLRSSKFCCSSKP